MGWMWLGWILLLAVLALVVWQLSRAQKDRSVEDSPEVTLKRRYAKGEMDRETYERMLSDLRK